jgi:hypothetical protein
MMGCFALTSCDVLLQTANTVLEQSKPLTTADVAQGLKEALKVGTDTAIVQLTRTNGYYLNQALKINLPPETDEIIKYAKKVPGMEKLIEDVVLQINRSAEDAAKQAAPIFKSAITSMTIADAWGILNGNENAATMYLKEKTNTQLFNLFLPKMQESLKKPIVGNVSAQQTWNDLTTTWNKFASSTAGKILNVHNVSTKLDQFVTDKALNGLYSKIAEEELDIRTKTNARVTELLKRVFEKK